MSTSRKPSDAKSQASTYRSWSSSDDDYKKRAGTDEWPEHSDRRKLRKKREDWARHRFTEFVAAVVWPFAFLVIFHVPLQYLIDLSDVTFGAEYLPWNNLKNVCIAAFVVIWPALLELIDRFKVWKRAMRLGGRRHLRNALAAFVIWASFPAAVLAYVLFMFEDGTWDLILLPLAYWDAYLLLRWIYKAIRMTWVWRFPVRVAFQRGQRGLGSVIGVKGQVRGYLKLVHTGDEDENKKTGPGNGKGDGLDDDKPDDDDYYNYDNQGWDQGDNQGWGQDDNQNWGQGDNQGWGQGDQGDQGNAENWGQGNADVPDAARDAAATVPGNPPSNSAGSGPAADSATEIARNSREQSSEHPLALTSDVSYRDFTLTAARRLADELRAFDLRPGDNVTLDVQVQRATPERPHPPQRNRARPHVTFRTRDDEDNGAGADARESEQGELPEHVAANLVGSDDDDHDSEEHQQELLRLNAENEELRRRSEHLLARDPFPPVFTLQSERLRTPAGLSHRPFEPANIQTHGTGSSGQNPSFGRAPFGSEARAGGNSLFAQQAAGSGLFGGNTSGTFGAAAGSHAHGLFGAPTTTQQPSGGNSGGVFGAAASSHTHGPFGTSTFGQQRFGGHTGYPFGVATGNHGHGLFGASATGQRLFGGNTVGQAAFGGTTGGQGLFGGNHGGAQQGYARGHLSTNNQNTSTTFDSAAANQARGGMAAAGAFGGDRANAPQGNPQGPFGRGTRNDAEATARNQEPLGVSAEIAEAHRQAVQRWRNMCGDDWYDEDGNMNPTMGPEFRFQPLGLPFSNEDGTPIRSFPHLPPHRNTVCTGFPSCPGCDHALENMGRASNEEHQRPPAEAWHDEHDHRHHHHRHGPASPQDSIPDLGEPQDPDRVSRSDAWTPHRAPRSYSHDPPPQYSREHPDSDEINPHPESLVDLSTQSDDTLVNAGQADASLEQRPGPSGIHVLDPPSTQTGINAPSTHAASAETTERLHQTGSAPAAPSGTSTSNVQVVVSRRRDSAPSTGDILSPGRSRALTETIMESPPDALSIPNWGSSPVSMSGAVQETAAVASLPATVTEVADEDLSRQSQLQRDGPADDGSEAGEVSTRSQTSPGAGVADPLEAAASGETSTVTQEAERGRSLEPQPPRSRPVSRVPRAASLAATDQSHNDETPRRVTE